MATFSRILRRTFSTATAAATTTTTAAEPTVRALSDSLHKERSLKRLVEKFKKSSLEPRFRTKTGIYEDVVRRLASAKCFNWIEEILEDQKRFKDMSKEGFNARLINLYGKAGMFGKAREVFDEMPSRGCDRTTLSFNALLSACLNSKKVEKVEELFKGLSKEMGIQPDVVSYNTLIKAYCDMGSLDSGLEMIKEMEGKGLAPNLVTYNTILHRLYANVKLDDGEKIWGQMLEKGVTPDIRTYNAKLLGLCSAKKKMEEAGKLVNEMGSKGVEPDVHSFIAMIRGCVKDGDLEGAKGWYEEILKREIELNKTVFDVLVPFLCEKGDLRYAFEVCCRILDKKIAVDGNVVQSVVDGLVKGEKGEEAGELVQLGRANRYKIVVP
ncbi:Pentatricopeptide repeat-containing protein At3g13160, mitochondrial [Linum perenne]